MLATRRRATSANDRAHTTAPRPTAGPGAPTPPDGGRRTIRRRRRSPIVPVAIAAVLVVVAATLAGYYKGSWRHETGFSAAYDALPNSQAIAVLEAKRQEIIDLTAASETVNTSSAPKLVAPMKVVAAAKAKAQEQEEEAEERQQAAAAASASAAASAAAAAEASSGSSTTSTDTDTATGELSPSAAQTVAQQLMPSYGFSVSSQFTCLLDIWNRESGWEWDAENASGAYGIPQSLPASKMASAGSDYMTDATTQIKWGLSYIQSTYGSPCAAWDFEEANGYY